MSKPIQKRDHLTVLVPSDVPGKLPYFADLLANNAWGQCACPDWQMKRKKLIRKGERPREQDVCKHIRRARWEQMDEWLLVIIGKMKKKRV